MDDFSPMIQEDFSEVRRTEIHKATLKYATNVYSNSHKEPERAQ